MPSNDQKKRWMPFLWMAFIFLTSSSVVTPKQMAAGVSAGTGVRPETFLTFWEGIWWIFVKGYHALEFAFLYWLLSRVFSVRFSFVVACGYAVVDEFHQVIVRSRGGRVSDILIDWIGILVIWLLMSHSEKLKLRTWEKIAIGIAIFALVQWLSLKPFGSLEPLFGLP